MRKNLVHILLLFSSLNGAAQHVRFESSLQTAFEKARQANKEVFVEYYNANCPVCKKLEPVFSDSMLAAFYNEHFINYKLNTENMKAADSLFMKNERLNPESVPYFLFFDKYEHFLHYSGTRQDINYLIAAGQIAMDPESRSSSLITLYNSGDRSIKTLYAYSNLLSLYRNDSLRSIIADELYYALPKEQLGTEKSYIITKNSVTSIDNGFFRYWIKHPDAIKEFEKKPGTLHEVDVLGNILLKSINSKERKNWDLDKVREVKKMITLTGLGDPNAFFWEQESELLVKAGRSGEAIQILEELMAKDIGSFPAAIYDIEYFLGILSQKNDLVQVKPWIARLEKTTTEGNEIADLMYTRVLYYKKIKDQKTAKALGKQAVEYYKARNIDAAKLKELLASL